MRPLKTLRKPHPFIFNAGSVLLPGVITLLILLVLAPFGFEQLTWGFRLGVSTAIAAITSLSVLLVMLLIKKIYPSFESVWTVGKELGLIVSVVMVIALLIFAFLLASDLTQEKAGVLFREVFLKTIAISVLPITVVVLFEQYRYQKQQALEARLLSESLTAPDQLPVLIPFHAENGSMEMQLKDAELLYLKAEGNYVEVFYYDQVLRKKLIRNRLKNLMEKLPPGQFFHCHKSFVVNRSNILGVEGNARNFVLKLRNTDQPIPVSRAKSEALRQFIQT